MIAARTRRTRAALPKDALPAISRLARSRTPIADMTSPYDCIEFFELLDSEQRQAFERLVHAVTVAKNDVVINHESVSTDVFFVIQGEFEVTIYSEKGRTVFYRTIGPGGVFGELAAIDGAPRTATVSALSEGSLARMSGPEFRKMLECSPKAAMWLIQRHTASIRALTARLFEQVAHDVNTRIRGELLRLAVDTQGNQARIFPVPTHAKLATTVGTTREAVTREFGDLVRKGFIERRGKEVIILDFDRLKRLYRQQTTIP